MIFTVHSPFQVIAIVPQATGLVNERVRVIAVALVRLWGDNPGGAGAPKAA
jgi:hypothetical protein